MMDEIFVQDTRPDNAPSLKVVPRLNSYADLTSWAKVTIDQSQGWTAAKSNDLVWKCVGFYIQDGPATFIPKFQNENGSPANNIGVVHSWPGAPVIPNDVSVVPDYSGKVGVIGFTNPEGQVGFGYSGGMAYSGSKPFTGLGKIWPLCPTHLSEPKFADCAEGLGWFGGTEHTTVNPVFKSVRKVTPQTGFSIGLYQNGQDLGIRIGFTNYPSGEGWELVLLDSGGQVLGSSQFR